MVKHKKIINITVLVICSLLILIGMLSTSQNAFSMNVGKIVKSSESKRLFVLNHGSNDAIKMNDEADFYLGVLNFDSILEKSKNSPAQVKDSKSESNQSLFIKLGKAKVIKLLSTKSVWVFLDYNYETLKNFGSQSKVTFFNYRNYDRYFQFVKEYKEYKEPKHGTKFPLFHEEIKTVVLPSNQQFKVETLKDIEDIYGNGQPNSNVKLTEREVLSVPINQMRHFYFAPRRVPAVGVARWEEKGVQDIEDSDFTSIGPKGVVENKVEINDYFPPPNLVNVQKGFREERIQSKIKNYIEVPVDLMENKESRADEFEEQLVR